MVLLGKEREVTIDQINEQVAQTDEVVSPALREQIERVLARKNHVALKVPLLALLDVLPCGWINVPLDKAKVNYSYPVQGVFVIRLIAALADQYIV